MLGDQSSDQSSTETLAEMKEADYNHTQPAWVVEGGTIETESDGISYEFKTLLCQMVERLASYSGFFSSHHPKKVQI